MEENYQMYLEQPEDYRENENLTREAFWDVYRPGCSEHLVLHNLRKSKNFIPELSYVIKEGNHLIGSIAYSKVKINEEDGKSYEAIGFGPISVDPAYQKKGIGSKLIEVSVKRAKELGYPAIFITGNTNYYHRFGFESASRYGIYLEGMSKEDEAAFFMVLVLDPEKIKNIQGICEWDKAFEPDNDELLEFEKAFPYKEKREARDSDLD